MGKIYFSFHLFLEMAEPPCLKIFRMIQPEVSDQYAEFQPK